MHETKAKEKMNKQGKLKKNKFEEHTVESHSKRRNNKCFDYCVPLSSEGQLQQTTPIKDDSI
jgi:hypothetical protein